MLRNIHIQMGYTKQEILSIKSYLRFQEIAIRLNL